MRNPPILLAVLILVHAAQCGTIYWDGTGTSWNVPASWTTNPNDAAADPVSVPNGDDVVFSSSGVTAAQTITLDQNQTAHSITMSGPASAGIQDGSETRVLTLINGITLGPDGGSLTIGRTNSGLESAILSLAGNQTWTNNRGPTGLNTIKVVNRVVFDPTNAATAMELVLAGNTPSSAVNAISGSIGENGSAVLSLTLAADTPQTRWRLGEFNGIIGSVNTYRGATNINSGALIINHPSALGAPNVTSVAAGAGLFIEYTGTMAPEGLLLAGNGPAGAAYGALQAINETNRWTGMIEAATSSTGARLGAINNTTLILDGALSATGTGELVFQTGSSGTDSGKIIINGDVSFPGQRLTKSADGTNTGTLVLNGTNSYGTTTIAGGILQVGNGGTTGTLGIGSVAIHGTLAHKRSDSIVVSNAITGGGTLVQAGTGTLTLNSPQEFNGTVRISGGGSLALDFTPLVTPTDLIQSGALILNGGRLKLVGHGTQVASHAFSGTTVSAGHSVVEVNTNNGVAANLSLGALTRANGGGTLEFLASASGSITTTKSNVNGILAAYATFGSSDWATRDAAGNVIAFTGYNNASSAMNANRDVPFSSINAPWSVRFNQPAAHSINLIGAIGSGGILVTPNVGANLSQISNGVSTGSGQDLIIHQNNPAGGLTINGIGINTANLIKTGPGLLTLSTSSSAAFVTRIAGGTVSVASDSALGTRIASGTIVFTPGSTGTLQLTGSNMNLEKGIVLDGSGIIDVPGLATLRSSLSREGITGTGSFIKTGPGRLVFDSTLMTNSYTGATIISEGTLETPTISLGGWLSGIGSSSSDASNLVIDGGTLRLAGTDPSNTTHHTDRLFTIGPGGATLEQSTSSSFWFKNSGVIALSGSNLPRTLTLAGSQDGGSPFKGSTLASILQDNGTGATSLRKTGVSQWNLTGANSYTGGTIIEGGKLAASLSGTFGRGDVRVESTATNLTINSDAVNAIADTASLTLAGDGLLDNQTTVGYAFLDSGVNEAVGGLVLGGVPQLDFGSTYGATGSGANHIFDGAAHIYDDYFKGAGVITLVPEPSATLAMLSGLGVLVGAQRMRRRR